MTGFTCPITIVGLLCLAVCAGAGTVSTWPAPEGEPASEAFDLRVDGREVFVYRANVRYEILKQKGLWSHKPDAGRQTASFSLFDFRGEVTVELRPKAPFDRVEVLPASAGVESEVDDGVVRLKLDRPRHLTLVFDGDAGHVLHLLCAEPQARAPSPRDRDVVYFGPGMHELTEPIRLKSGQTLYIAGGAVLRAKLRPDETGRKHPKFGIRHYPGQVIVANGVKNVRILGRGIVDASAIPHPGRNMIAIRRSENVRIEGIVLRDAATWNVHLRESKRIEVDNLRIIAGRLNSDGINSVSSRNVHIYDCFVRNRDDSIVAKSKPAGPTQDILVERCTIWNDWGYALGVTYETQSDIRNVVFRDCDVLQAHIAAMGIYATDAGTVENIRFENIRVGDLTYTKQYYGKLPWLIRVGLKKDMWATDKEFGTIRDVRFRDIAVHGPLPRSEIFGQPKHPVRDVLIRDLTVNGQRLGSPNAANLQTNPHVENIRVMAGD